MQSKEAKNARARAYYRTEEGKAARAAYLQSEGYKTSLKTRRQSEKRIAYQKAYNQSEKRKKANQLLQQSERYKEVAKAYRKSEHGHAALRAARYGITAKRLKELLAAGCYAPGCTATDSEKNRLQIDHDHDCCKGYRSCGSCVRGALCRRHNLYLGWLESDWLFAIWALRQPSLVIKVRREA